MFGIPDIEFERRNVWTQAAIKAIGENYTAPHSVTEIADEVLAGFDKNFKLERPPTPAKQTPVSSLTAAEIAELEEE